MTGRLGKSERVTQNRVLKVFEEELKYINLGDWSERDDNSNIEVEILKAYLDKAGYKAEQITQAIYKIQTEANNHNRSLYQNNKEVYSLLRYGAQIKMDAGKPAETIHFINWTNPEANDFAIAEEVTLNGTNERRPDLVLYINGIAIGLIELKRSGVGVGEGIRQLISNQRAEFNEGFFSTAQILFAGNDTEGLKYGTIMTAEKYYLTWKENEEENDRYKLDKYLLKMCEKKRIIEILHNFVLFDAGVKKLPRVHQYFGIKKAQEHVNQREGGIIWHTQGSGKSIVMVLLAKWILENKPNARILIVTDRDELDEQIERVFRDAGESIYRTNSGKDLATQLAKTTPRLLCSLVHKFSQRDVDDANWESFIKDLKEQGGKAVGEFYVLVDECHRTQSGKLHQAMTAIMPNAIFIGFTGTPLLKKDKETSLKIFGKYIHTYKFGEAVDDGVVLDLLYEARDVDQDLGSETKIDQWFDTKTKGLNDWQKDKLKKRWSTLRKLFSSGQRLDKVVNDIVFDFSVKPRLSNDRGNAILVASSILEACKYWDIFQDTPYASKCGVVTSYDLDIGDTSKEDTGNYSATDKKYIFDTYQKILKDVQPEAGTSKAKTYEKHTKNLFIKEPANMKILIVVSKLLTGFDAPSCTYLYIDKHMDDHGLFQAICRTNRLDGEDKEFGYIVDYRDLFKKVEKAIAVYSAEIDHSSDADGVESDILMKNRIDKAKERLEQAIENWHLVFEAVPMPKGELESIQYFCGNTEKPNDLKEREHVRVSLYKVVAEFTRSYANLADAMETAGYTHTDVTRIEGQIYQATALSDLIHMASGEELDLKPFESDMRFLIDNFIKASDPRPISNFGNLSLLELIVKTGIADAITQKMGRRKLSKKSSAEVIENNVRSKIIKERPNNPAYYDQMSKLLDEVIQARKDDAESYEEYLKKIADLAVKVQTGGASSSPSSLKTQGQRALYNNLGNNEVLALKIDSEIKNIAHDGWRGVLAKERVIKGKLHDILNNDDEVERIFQLLLNQKEY